MTGNTGRVGAMCCPRAWANPPPGTSHPWKRSPWGSSSPGMPGVSWREGCWTAQAGCPPSWSGLWVARGGESMSLSLTHTVPDTHAEPHPPSSPSLNLPLEHKAVSSSLALTHTVPPSARGSELRVWPLKSLLILRSPILGRQGCIYLREQQLATLPEPFPTATRLPGHSVGLGQWGWVGWTHGLHVCVWGAGGWRQTC